MDIWTFIIAIFSDGTLINKIIKVANVNKQDNKGELTGSHDNV